MATVTVPFLVSRLWLEELYRTFNFDRSLKFGRTFVSMKIDEC
jgi:hypothetical protein